MNLKVPEIDTVVDGGTDKSRLWAGYIYEQLDDQYFHLEYQRQRRNCVRAIDPQDIVAGAIRDQAAG